MGKYITGIFIESILNLFLAYKIYDYIKASEKKIIRIPIAMNTSNEYIYKKNRRVLWILTEYKKNW